MRSSPKMTSLWKRAIESNKALLLDEIGLGPDALLKVVEAFEAVSQGTEHSYTALVTSSKDGSSSGSGSNAEYEGGDGEDYSEDEMFSEDDEHLLNEPLDERNHRLNWIDKLYK